MATVKKTGKWEKSPQKLIDLFDDVMDCHLEATKKKMFGYPCCFLGGNMFTGLHQKDWVLRLDDADREEMESELKAKGFEPMGRRMKQYIIIPKKILSDTDELHGWIAKSMKYAKSLPKKVPKKKKIKK